MTMTLDERVYFEEVKIKGREVTELRVVSPDKVTAAMERHNTLTQLHLQQVLIKEQIEALEKACAKEGHVVRYDTPGLPYDQRWCAGCGAFLGSI